MRERPLLIFVTASLLVLGCAGSKSVSGDRGKDQVIDALTLFVEAVQEGRFELAFSYLTPEERRKMNDRGSQDKSVLERRLKAMRLSTLAHKPGVRLNRGKLEGIYEQMPNLGDAPAPGYGQEPPPDDPSL